RILRVGRHCECQCGHSAEDGKVRAAPCAAFTVSAAHHDSLPARKLLLPAKRQRAPRAREPAAVEIGACWCEAEAGPAACRENSAMNWDQPARSASRSLSAPGQLGALAGEMFTLFSPSGGGRMVQRSYVA